MILVLWLCVNTLNRLQGENMRKIKHFTNKIPSVLFAFDSLHDYSIHGTRMSGNAKLEGII